MFYMVKRILPCIASILVAGNVFSQDIFSWYSIGSDTNSLRHDTSVRGEFSSDKLLSYWKKPLEEQSFPNHYTTVLEEKFRKRKISMFDDSNEEGEFRYGSEMAGALFETCIRRYELAARAKQFALKVREKTTVETDLDSSKSTESSLKLAIRPSANGLNYPDIGIEVFLRNAKRESLASFKTYYNGVGFKLPLTRWWNRHKVTEESFETPRPKVSFGLDYRDKEGSAIIKYERIF